MSRPNTSEQTPDAGGGDHSLRNFFGGLMIVWIVLAALMAVIERTYG